MKHSLQFLTSLLVCGLLLFGPSRTYGQSYDIYVHDTKTGTTQQVTTLGSSDEFNPSFSNNSKKLVHDVLPFGGGHDLYITTIATGVSTALVGGDGGNDADWSPDGSKIAFDRVNVGDANIYTVPSTGGTRTLVRANAIDADWAPDSRRLVFQDITDSSIRTFDTVAGTETLIAASGINPTWSPVGDAIAYSNGDDLLVQAVDLAGAPVGAPIFATSDGAATLDQQPSFSNNGKTLVFHRGASPAFDFDIYTVPSDGSASPSALVGVLGVGDFDPAFSKNGKLVAYAAQGLPTIIAPDVEKSSAEINLQQTTGFDGSFDASSHPNPFNPSTVISFTLPSEVRVSVTVHNVLGQQLVSLYSGTLSAGRHEIAFDASDLPSGTYLYRIDAGQNSIVKQLLLLK